MKKLMFATMALAAGLAVADVSSQNIVGYQTFNCTGGKYYMIGAQFQNVGGAKIKIADFLKSPDLCKGFDYDDAANAAKIQIWNPAGLGGYDEYRYAENDYFEEPINTWANSEGDPTDATIDVAVGCWFKQKDDCALTVAGEVVSAEDKDVKTFANKYNMMCNPYPIALDLNGGKVDWTALSKGFDYDDSSCPKIQVWNPAGLGGYDEYHYAENDYFEEPINCWANSEGDPATKGVPCGSAFWLKYTKDAADFTFTFEK